MCEQQLLYIQTLFGTFNGRTQHVSVTAKGNIRYDIELYPSGDILCYRINHESYDAPTNWSTWSDKEQVEDFFRITGLI